VTDSLKNNMVFEELENLKRINLELSNELNSIKNASGNKKLTRSPRVELGADIEFIGDFDIVNATGIDISDGGLCFELSAPLPFDMRFEHKEEDHSYRANLAWMRQLPDGKYRFGFEFVKKGLEDEGDLTFDDQDGDDW
jgi:hypothetical protein